MRGWRWGSPAVSSLRAWLGRGIVTSREPQEGEDKDRERVEELRRVEGSYKDKKPRSRTLKLRECDARQAPCVYDQERWASCQCGLTTGLEPEVGKGVGLGIGRGCRRHGREPGI